ncbi:MAG: hypothetical protein ACOX3K_00215 [Bacilli bacterium]|jgi:hypothetical protein
MLIYLIPFLLLGVGFIFGMLGFASWRIGLVIGGLYLFVGFFFVVPLVRQYQIRSSRQKSGYQFMNNFLLTLSVHRNIPHTYKILEKQFSPELRIWAKRIEGMLPQEKTAYLTHYFHIDIYHLFVDFLKVYEQEGGEVLTMGELLLGSIREQMRSLTRDEFLFARKIGEFSLLWGLTFVILLATRFSLGTMYQRMLNSALFLFLLSIFFLIFITALVAVIRAMFLAPIDNKGRRHYEVVAKRQGSWFKRKKD